MVFNIINKKDKLALKSDLIDGKALVSNQKYHL